MVVEQPSLEIEGATPMSVIVVVTRSPACGCRCTNSELGVFLGNLTVSNNLQVYLTMRATIPVSLLLSVACLVLIAHVWITENKYDTNVLFTFAVLS